MDNLIYHNSTQYVCMYVCIWHLIDNNSNQMPKIIKQIKETFREIKKRGQDISFSNGQPIYHLLQKFFQEFVPFILITI